MSSPPSAVMRRAAILAVKPTMAHAGGLRSQTHRGVFTYIVTTIAFVLLLLVGITLLDPSAASAQNLAFQQSPELMKEPGRQIGVVDWIYHLPVALAVVLLVVAVDAVVIFRSVRSRRGRQ